MNLPKMEDMESELKTKLGVNCDGFTRGEIERRWKLLRMIEAYQEDNGNDNHGQRPEGYHFIKI
jgi:hypothetical protein